MPSHAQPPGPRGLELLGTLQALRENHALEYLRLFKKYGDVVFLPLVNRYVFFHPQHIQHILVDHSARYVKGKDFAILRRLLGDGLVTSEGETWKSQRRVVGSEFHANRVQGFAP